MTQAETSGHDPGPQTKPALRLRKSVLERPQHATAATASPQRPEASQAPSAAPASIQPVLRSTKVSTALATPAAPNSPPATAAAASTPATTVIGALADLFGLRSPTSPLAPLQRLLEPDGTYNPAPAWAHDTGGSVDFTVVVSDASSPLHLHLFSGGHSTKVLVHYDIAQVNADPDVAITGVAQQADGSVKYTVTTSDSDRDTVTLTTSALNGTLSGGLTTTPNTYAYTYTPDPDYAHRLTVGGATAVGVGQRWSSRPATDAADKTRSRLAS